MKNLFKLAFTALTLSVSVAACHFPDSNEKNGAKPDSLQTAPDKTSVDTTLKADTLKKDTTKKDSVKKL